ncbi:MAG: DNA gyrase inhibitor YacG [Alphaproteobacteria bacterium]|nr:DNA gyrase inhibitor YacG [Alphaproteobacteria bacterium]MBV9695190.1 DNA gyrase inhibitor YacG [Alphaproteobacteria bacterium]
MSRQAERRCAVCGKLQETRFRPFCSRHCADVDLACWLDGRYAIAAEEAPRERSDEPDQA